MEIILLLICYLVGSIPIAWILAKLVTGKDIRTMGSGNVGVMNTALSVTRWAGLLVFVGEAGKGAFAVLLARKMQVSDITLALAVVAVVAGTCWSIWMGGAGGRGNTAGLTALLMLAWESVAISLGVWVAARLLTRKSYTATRFWILSIPINLLLVTQSWAFAGMGVALSLIYLSEHDTNTDDHTRIKDHWPNLWAFLSSPRRKIRP